MRRADVLHVPVGNHLRAVGIDRRRDDADDVVEDLLRFGIGAGEAVVDELGCRLRCRHLARVQREGLDDDRLALGDELLRLGLGQSARIGQPRVDLLVVIELGEVGRRRDEERDVRPALARLAELDEPHLVRRLRQHLVVLEQLVPVGKLAIGAHLEAEELLRRRNRRAAVPARPRSPAARRGR